MNTRDQILEIVKDAITKICEEHEISINDLPQAKIEYPKEQKFGDYSTPFALESARFLKKSPIDIGKLLIEHIKTHKLVDEVDVVKPGFINMFLSFDHLIKTLHQIINEGENYGKEIKSKPRKINIEFVSANPTGPLNIVSARAAALGDTLANLLEMTGDTVDREFYVNDYGNQVYLLGKSVLARAREISGQQAEFPEDGYQGEYVKNIARHILDAQPDVLSSFTDEEDLINHMAKSAIDFNVSTQKIDLEDFNVKFKTWFRESSLHNNDDVLNTLAYLDSKGVIYEHDGKKFFSSTGFGDDKDRVVMRDDGRPTYHLADIAYHRNKINRSYDLIINIWGPDHHGYIARLRGAVEALGYNVNNFKVLIAQQVNLIMEGESVKMSKRLGKFATMRDLLDEIGVDVSRYFFIMRSMDSHLDFDLTLAQKESSENPVFYLQYAHARICSLFREAEKRGIAYDHDRCKTEYLNNSEGIVLLKMMLKYPEEIFDAATSMEPHRITTYLMKLAQSFHRFYTEHRFLSDDLEQTNTYLTLADAVRIVMKSGLKVIGVSAPDQM